MRYDEAFHRRSLDARRSAPQGDFDAWIMDQSREIHDAIDNALDLNDRIGRIFHEAPLRVAARRVLRVIVAAGSASEMVTLNAMLQGSACEIVARVEDPVSLCRQALHLKPDVVVASAAGATVELLALIQAIGRLASTGIVPAVVIEGQAGDDLIGDGMIRKVHLPVDQDELMALIEKVVAFQREVIDIGDE